MQAADRSGVPKINDHAVDMWNIPLIDYMVNILCFTLSAVS